ncbi:AI-2E family transporter [Microvirga subterranea]|uniref:Putative PurR-regulated permease PerM n=1 Tax=Microvirga subterranea TaxID=186651 RepID=A0A370H6X0_9HYPH|nr:AI-2E family transporter [Microvirga subterranea]RDI51358.1 putative PurR-regulated permease PerM [Microvirga subterranea]
MLDISGRDHSSKKSDPLSTDSSRSLGLTTVTQVLAGVALLGALKFGLLTSLLAGLLVHELVHTLAPRPSTLVTRRVGKIVVVSLLATVVVVVIGTGILGLVALLSGGPDSLAILLSRMAEVIESARPLLPDWLRSYIPADPQELKGTASAWLRENAGQLRLVGQDVWWALVHIIIGMVIGAMVAVSHEAGKSETGPLTQALMERARLLRTAFRNVVFAQVRISALNTLLTGLYLLVLVPLISVQLPLTKTLIAVTFIAGLLPVIGNLISNTAIVVVSLSVSPLLAVSSLVFLIAIHKLEYFVNAHVMGAHISARAWELLLAMLVMEALFGLVGLVAAPIYYAYLKNELAIRKLI